MGLKVLFLVQMGGSGFLLEEGMNDGLEVRCSDGTGFLFEEGRNDGLEVLVLVRLQTEPCSLADGGALTEVSGRRWNGAAFDEIMEE